MTQMSPFRCSFLVAFALLVPGTGRAQPASTAPAKSVAAGAASHQADWKAGTPPKRAVPTLAQPGLLSPSAPPTAAIDQYVARKWQSTRVTPAAQCDDAAYARRLYLDLAGRTPTPAEVDRFIADRSPKKRQALVDCLLASPEYAEHMRNVFDVVFMGRGDASPGSRRRRAKSGQALELREQWLDYLQRSFAENRPWNRTVRDLVLARPETPADRGSIWFLYGRGERYQEIAEAVAAGILGVQVQCAQCHNHFLAPEIKQQDYWGLVAFFNRSKNEDKAGSPMVAESAIGGFSNFATLAGQSFPAELAVFGANIPERRPAPNQKEEDSPALYRPLPEGASAMGSRVPIFSRRAQFADRVLAGNPRVARAAVNRFWALLMGRGIVHPVDKMDSGHDPSHPELLDWLARDFVRSGYDVKRLVRAIVLSRPYQLMARRNPTVPPELFASALEKPLTAEQLYRSLLVATTGRTDTENEELRKALVSTFPDVFPEEDVSTLSQAMFLTNNPLVQQLTRVAPGTTAERLAAIIDPVTRARQAFRIAYARNPDAGELQATAQFLKVRRDRPAQATAELWWALLAGAEFRFNH